MIDDLVLNTRAMEKNKTSIRSVASPFLQLPENDLSPHTQPKWFLTSLSITRLEEMPWPRERPNGSKNNHSRPLWVRFSSPRRIVPHAIRSKRSYVRLRDLTLNLLLFVYQKLVFSDVRGHISREAL